MSESVGHFCMAWGSCAYCAICGKEMPVSTQPNGPVYSDEEEALIRAAAVPQQEAGEPVARPVCERTCVMPQCRDAGHCQHPDSLATPQPSPLQARVPLTLEQVWANDGIMSLIAEIGFPMPFLMRTVRAIERAHGIGLETKE